MSYWSFTVKASGEVHLEDHLVVLDSGMNTFNAVIEDFDAFRGELADFGVQIVRAHRLDDLEAIEPVPEVAEALGRHQLGR